MQIKIRFRPQLLSFTFFIFIVFLTGTSAGFSQGLGGMKGKNRLEGRFKFLPLPYINYNRSIGATFGALPMAMFNPVENDTLSPSSVAGLLGVYSTNKTWFGMGFAALFFDQDTWRVLSAAGLGSVNFQFYLDNPVDKWIPYNTAADVIYLQVKRRVVNKIYAGVSYVHTTFQTTTELFPDSLNNMLNGLGFVASMDKRSNFYYPWKGFHSNIKYFTYPEAFGNEFVSNKIAIDHNHYVPFRSENDVLATRIFAGIGIGELTFNQQFIVGQVDIRGYSEGAYRGDYMLAIQGEYRWNFHNRLGMVGFLGFATVFDSINEDDDGKILPGIGTGIRFTAFTDTNMNVGMDIAAGLDDWGIYFRIGEAF
jgi:hypothetical protein